MSTNKNRAKTERTFTHVLSKKLANLLSSTSSNSPTATPPMLSLVGRHLRRLLHRLCRCRRRRQPKTKITIINNPKHPNSPKPNPHTDPVQTRPIRIATFNAAMFSMAPAVGAKTPSERPTKGILKHNSFSASKRRVSINLPEDEISVERSKGKGIAVGRSFSSCSWRFSERSVLDVVKEAGADVIALQNVKAEEEKGMRPLSELAEGLGMRYVFAESWAPEYGNAILSRWEIKEWKAQKICDDSDFRYVSVFLGAAR